MSRLENHVAIVTGASSGIGLATARVLARAGARVVLNARRVDRLEAAARETGGVAVPGDIVDASVRERVVAACGDRIDILVNNAGYPLPGAIEMVDEAAARRQVDVNVFAPVALIRAVMPRMRAQRSGRIVNISSVAGRFGYPLFGWYCATKHALEGLSDSLRLEAQAWNIGVSLVEPGPVETEFFDTAKRLAAAHIADRDGPYAPFYRDVEGIEADFRKQATTPERIAATVLRACTARRPRARYTVSFPARAATFLAWLLPRAWFDRVIRGQFGTPGPGDVG